MDAEAYTKDALSAVERASSAAELDEARVRYLGRKSELKQALREVRDRETGMALNAAREAIEEALEARQKELGRAELDALTEETVDISLPGDAQPRGRLHLITQVRREVEDIFLGMGYEVVEGREVETTRYLFDALNMPPNHPTRSPLQTFYLNGDIVLRTETSPAQIHTMEKRDPPIYMVSLGRCYRRDTPDATHYPIFHQVEGLVVDRNITLADLKGTLQHLLRSLFGEERETRFATHYFPFTEPSIESYVSCFLCDGSGCRVCKHSGWIEIGGAGMVDPNVFEFVGYDPEEVTGFAFGWGLERMGLLRHGLPDIRALWENDLRLLEQF
ncbi:MAG TPA: phenylalanine--tRNA ligase subunit alpha [Gaiellaceae bacterium]|nr:phenylalanine--tRNA ligase subunit alpha [Gaiellaceae bacterium]